MTADTDPAEAALWALTYLEAQDADDETGIRVLLADVPKEIVAQRLAGAAVGLLIDLCLVTGVSPGVWPAEKRAQLNGMDGAA